MCFLPCGSATFGILCVILFLAKQQRAVSITAIQLVYHIDRTASVLLNEGIARKWL